MSETRRTVWVSKGEVEYVGGTVTEAEGKDLTAATFTIALGDYRVPPDAFFAPDVDEPGATPNVRTVKLLVEAGTKPEGEYWIWVSIADSPERPFVRFPTPVRIA